MEGAPKEKREKAWLKGNLLDCLEAHLIHIPFVPARIALKQFSLEGREDLVDSGLHIHERRPWAFPVELPRIWTLLNSAQPIVLLQMEICLVGWKFDLGNTSFHELL